MPFLIKTSCLGFWLDQLWVMADGHGTRNHIQDNKRQHATTSEHMSGFFVHLIYLETISNVLPFR